MHNSGAEDEDEFYSHYRQVEWIIKDYYKKEDLIGEGETSWQPYGTVGALYDELPTLPLP